MGLALISGQETMIPQAERHGQEEKKKGRKKMKKEMFPKLLTISPLTKCL